MLGALFFVGYINDTVKVIRPNSAIYEDDVKIFKEIACKGHCLILQNDLVKLLSSSNYNLLPINFSVMSYSNKNAQILRD